MEEPHNGHTLMPSCQDWLSNVGVSYHRIQFTDPTIATQRLSLEGNGDVVVDHKSYYAENKSGTKSHGMFWEQR